MLLTPCAPVLHGLQRTTEAAPARIWTEVAGPPGVKESFQVSLPLEPVVANVAEKRPETDPVPLSVADTPYVFCGFAVCARVAANADAAAARATATTTTGTTTPSLLRDTTPLFPFGDLSTAATCTKSLPAAVSATAVAVALTTTVLHSPV